MLCMRKTKDDSIYIDRDNNNWLCTKCTSDIFPFNHYDKDVKFIHTLAECWENESNIMKYSDNYTNQLFMPFEYSEADFTHLIDFDPDVNFYQNLNNNCINKCDYYHEDSMNKNCKELDINKYHLSLLHNNIRSIPHNLDHFNQFLNGLDIDFSILAFSETWLKPHNEHCYGVNGYNAEHNSRLNKASGGVSLFIKKGIEYNKCSDLQFTTTTMESLFIEIDKEVFRSSNKIIIGVVYRPPNTDVDEFSDHMSNIVSILKTERKCCYLLGDFNLNLLNADTHSPTQEFSDLMYSDSLFPTITKPTRVTSHSATLIDNIFCNNILNEQALSGILYTDISDHYPIFYIDHSLKKTSKDVNITKRPYTPQNIAKFKTNLESHNWSAVLLHTETQTAYSQFHKEFSHIYDNCFPVRSVKLGCKNRKTWLTQGMKKSIKIKNNLFGQYRQHGTPELEFKYKQYRNNLNRMLRIAEREHYDVLFLNYKGNLKKSWILLKEVINRNKTRDCSSKFLFNGECITDKLKIANGFSSYFVYVGPNLGPFSVSCSE